MVGEAFVQTLPVELEVPADQLRVISPEDRVDLLRGLDRITPYTRDTRGRWSRATTSGEPADPRLNALFEWLVEEAERRGALELHGRYLVEGLELVDPDSETAS